MLLLRKIIATLTRSARDADLNEEIEGHLAMLEAEYMRRGMSAEEARLAAKREFGGIEQTKQIYREHRGVAFLENVAKDLQLSLRALRKSAGFAAVAIGSLAIGIGANTSMFSVVRAVKFRALPVPEPQELVQLRSFSPEYKTYGDNFSYPFVTELARASLFDSAAGMFPITASLFGGERTTQIPAELVTDGYFRTLRVRPALGRLLGPGDMRNPGADTVCVISYSLWHSRFDGRSDIVGRAIKLNGADFRIVGVTQRGFEGSVLYWPHDIQIPVTMTSLFMDNFPWQTANSTFLYSFARLRAGMTSAAADARIKVIGPQIGGKIRNPKNPDQTAKWNRFSLVTATQGPGLVDDKSLEVSLVSGIVLLTLLIACANIACLLLARASAQERETAVQISLGAPQTRIIQRYLVESVLLASAGAVFGFIASGWITRLFTYVLQMSYVDVQPDTGMFLFSIAACVVTALMFGIIPGWQASRTSARFVGLREQGTARVTRGQNVFRKLLVSVQIALATVLVIGCALFLRSLEKLQRVNLGFDPGRVALVEIHTSEAGHSEMKSLAIYRQVLDRVRLLPGIESATLAYGAPLSGITYNGSIASSRITNAKVPDRVLPAAIVSDGLFRTLGIPILRGRDFKRVDLHQTRTVIVNQAFVDYYRLGDGALGRQFRLDPDMPPIQIIGVVGNTKMQSVRESALPAVFFPVTDDTRGSLLLLARARGAHEAVFREIRTAIPAVDPLASVTLEALLEDKIVAQSFDQRAIASLCSAFSLFALLLSCMGIYGVAAYSISRRTQEIGVRVALGALRSDLAGLFLRESCWITALGLGIGVPAALVLASFIRNLLFGIEPADPLTLAVSALSLSGVCLLAAALPLKRAFQIDPAEALRGE